MHWRARSVAWLVCPFHLWPVIRQLLHAYLIAVVQERHSRHGESKGIDYLKFLVGTPISKSGVIMIAQRQAYIPLANSLFILIHVALEKRSYLTLPLSIKKAVSFTHSIKNSPAFFLEQVVIAIEPMEEIDMETVVEGVSRV